MGRSPRRVSGQPPRELGGVSEQGRHAAQPGAFEPRRAGRRRRTSPHQPGQQFIQGHAHDGGGMVAHGVGQDQLPAVDEGAAAVDHIGDVALPAIAFRQQQRLGEPPQHLRRVMEIQQGGADAVLAHGPHAVGEHQPARLGLEG